MPNLADAGTSRAPQVMHLRETALRREPVGSHTRRVKIPAECGSCKETGRHLGCQPKCWKVSTTPASAADCAHRRGHARAIRSPSTASVEDAAASGPRGRVHGQGVVPPEKPATPCALGPGIPDGSLYKLYVAVDFEIASWYPAMVRAMEPTEGANTSRPPPTESLTPRIPAHPGSRSVLRKRRHA